MQLFLADRIAVVRDGGEPAAIFSRAAVGFSRYSRPRLGPATSISLAPAYDDTW